MPVDMKRPEATSLEVHPVSNTSSLQLKTNDLMYSVKKLTFRANS